jgi:hypothetical protein
MSKQLSTQLTVQLKWPTILITWAMLQMGTPIQ